MWNSFLLNIIIQFSMKSANPPGSNTLPLCESLVEHPHQKLRGSFPLTVAIIWSIWYSWQLRKLNNQYYKVCLLVQIQNWRPVKETSLMVVGLPHPKLSVCLHHCHFQFRCDWPTAVMHSPGMSVFPAICHCLNHAQWVRALTDSCYYNPGCSDLNKE